VPLPLPLQGKPNHDKILAHRNEMKSCQQNNDVASKKRPLLMMEDAVAVDTSEKTNSQKGSQFIDLTDVQPQLPILKSDGKGGASKYLGVCFDEEANKWKAQIRIDGKNLCIGNYDNEKEAAVDYARAVFKYRAERKMQTVIDLSDVPPQLPIMSSKKNSSSKYEGVCFHKARNKWYAQIKIDEKLHSIGCYDNEEEAAVDYARAVFKYCLREEVLPMPMGWDFPHLYQKGVIYNPMVGKWMAMVTIDGRNQCIGYYDTAQAARLYYSRARKRQRQHGHNVSVEKSGREHIAQADDFHTEAS